MVTMEKVRFLKKYVLELELAVRNSDYGSFNSNINIIEKLISEINEEFKDSLSASVKKEDTSSITIDINDVNKNKFKNFGIDLDVEYNPSEGVVLKTLRTFNTTLLNTIKFIYKPVYTNDVYEGNYLEKFSEERTNELMNARVINNHNEFWKQYQTVKGNIYGSVPSELLTEESSSVLFKAGWKRVNVNVYDFGIVNVDMEELISFCDENYEHYILIFEIETETHILLEYII